MIRSALKFVCFFAMFTIINETLEDITADMFINSGWDFSWLSIAVMILVIGSVAWAFYNFNGRAKKHFTETYVKGGNRKLQALKSADFIIDTSISAILTFVSAFAFGYENIQNALFGDLSVHIVIKKLAAGFLVVVSFFLINWFMVYDIRKKWLRGDIKQKSKDTNLIPYVQIAKEFFKIFGYLLFITYAYIFTFYILLAYVPGLLAIIVLLKPYYLQIIAGIAAIAAASFLLVNLKRIRKRKEFVKNLGKTISAYGFELSEIKKPYFSLFKQVAGESFTVAAHGKTYKCKLISGKSKGVAMIFCDNGLLLFKRGIIIAKRELFSIYSAYDYAFEGDVKKCIVLTCIPAKCYYKDSLGRLREIDTGEKIGEYTVFSAQGFLRALEMDCLDR